MKRCITLGFGLASLAAGGALCALVIAPAASAWDWTNLPNGYSVSGSSYQKSDGSSCHIVRINGNLMGDDCVDATAMYVAIDAYVDSTICTVNPAAGGSRCAPTTSASSTTAEQTTTVAPPDTTTTIQAPGGGAATTDSSPSTAAAQPPPATTVTVTTADTSILAALAQLQTEISDLTTRVARLDLAGQAADLAYRQALGSGADPASATDAARGTYLNAEYRLGAFAT